MKRWAPWLGALMGLAVLSGNAATAPVDVLLERAEVARSAQPEAFDALLAELARRNAELGPAQREQLAYLGAYRLAFEGKYAQAAAQLRRLIGSSTHANVQARAGALLVNIHTRTRQFVEGLRQLETTLSLLPAVTEPDVRVHVFKEAAYLHNQVGQYALGLKYADRMLELASEPRGICFGQQIRFEALSNLEQLPEDAVVLQAIDQCLAHRETVVANAMRVTLAKRWAGQGRRDRAIAMLQKHLPEVEATGYSHLVILFKSQLARLLVDQGDLGAAESYAIEALGHIGESGNAYALSNAYHALYRIAEIRDDADKALVYYRRYVEADKAYLNDVKARELAYQIVRQETLEKSQQIQRLDSQNQLLKLQRRLDVQSARNTHLLIGLLVLLLASIGYWTYKTKRLQVSLRRLAETDELTGVCNRHHFSQCAGRLLAQCARHGEDVALIMFDLDHFKAVNDRYGHATGDWVLRAVADACRAMCRQMDVLGRLGGEEFALLVQADLRTAARLAEDCRVRIATLDTRPSGHRFQVTASFGVSVSAASGYALEHLLSQADALLYQSKRQGRDRISVQEALPDGPAVVPLPRAGQR